jgi:putative tricarboxylic transport membrane protein
LRRANQFVSLAFIAVGLYVLSESRSMTLFTEIGPGAGFFPFCLGIILVGLSALSLVQLYLKPTEGAAESFLPGTTGIVRIAAIVGSLFLFALLMENLGFSLTMLAFLLFLLLVLGRQRPAITAIISLAGSFGIFYIFRNWLDVQLPVSSIEFLRNLGL